MALLKLLLLECKKTSNSEKSFCFFICFAAIFSIWLLKFKVLSNVMLVLENFVGFPTKDISFLILLFLAKNKNWKFLGLGTISLLLSQFIAIFASISKFSETICKSLPRLHKLVPSTKLQMSVSFIKRIEEFMKILNKIGPNTGPWGTPGIISSYSLRKEPFFICYFLFDK